MYGLTQLGIIHTLISLVAVAAALAAFVRDKGINPANTLGQVAMFVLYLIGATLQVRRLKAQGK